MAWCECILFVAARAFCELLAICGVKSQVCASMEHVLLLPVLPMKELPMKRRQTEAWMDGPTRAACVGTSYENNVQFSFMLRGLSESGWWPTIARGYCFVIVTLENPVRIGKRTVNGYGDYDARDERTTRISKFEFTLRPVKCSMRRACAYIVGTHQSLFDCSLVCEWCAARALHTAHIRLRVRQLVFSISCWENACGARAIINSTLILSICYFDTNV